MARTQLYLVRHGEQDPASGHAADGSLSQLGRKQADRLGRRLCTVPFSAVHHSPLARAAQTADIVARHLPHVPRHNCDFVVDRTPVPSPAERGRYRDAGMRGSTPCPMTSATWTPLRCEPLLSILV